MSNTRCSEFYDVASDSASIVNHRQWQVPDESNFRPHKRCRLDPEDEGTNSAGPSRFHTCIPPKNHPSATYHVGTHNESGLTYCPNVVELGPASLPPRHRRQWSKQREHTDVSSNDTGASSPNPPSSREAIDVIDETDISNGMASAGLDTDKKVIYDESDSSSESDSESDYSSCAVIPLVPIPADSNVSTMAIDLEHLNAAARGVMNDIHTYKLGNKRPRRRRLVMTGGSVRHPLEGMQVVEIPKSAYNTARRVLVPESIELPLVTVSMRADLQFFHQQKRYRLSRYSLPNKDGYRHVVDATMISDTVIVAYGAGPTQISLLQLIEGHQPTLVDLPVQPHKSTLDPHKRGTIACLSPCTTNHNAIRFFTGGYDKGIRMWSGHANQPASWASKELFRTSTNPEALAFRRSRRTMLVACSKKLLDIHVDHLAQRPASVSMSNAIHQLHAHKEVENIIILEVDSLDYQIHLYDDRKKNGFDRTSDCYFGRRGRTAKHSKGDTRGNLFARGYDDGTVCVWDVRNAKQPILTKTYHELGSLVHTTFLNMDLVCYGKAGLTFLDISAPDC